MSTTPFLMVLHNHQPVGNLPWVVDDCYRTAYLPFLEALERHARVRIGLHYTGPLLEWLQAEHPEYLMRVRALAARGQVEVLGGGFYEPILAVLPERDRMGQLLLMQERVCETFGQPPAGAWLAERVWEPCLPVSLQAAGVGYVLLDDEGLHRLGYTEEQTCGTYLTEDEGSVVRVLPISRRLRYTLPTKTVPEVLETLREMAQHADVLIYAEDGERYGNWPGTYDYLYGEEAYLEELFSALEEADELELLLPSEYVHRAPARGLVYLPPSSYAEMMEWSGGFWRNFLVRYRESNLMHKLMCQVSEWVAGAEAAGHQVQEAKRHLYAAQCNCGYWYGAFGGLYLPHLRRAVYHHLLKAEAAVAPLLPAHLRGACQIGDVDLDGHEEVFLRSNALTLGIAPAQGGGLFALGHLGVAHNFLATMGRYALPAVEGEAQPDVPVDWHPRFAFLDHLLPAGVTVEALRDARYGEQGDFVTGEYAVVRRSAGEVVLARDGHFWDGPEFAPLRVEKHYALAGDAFRVTYVLTNTGDAARTVCFGAEIDACLSSGEGEGRSLIVEVDGARETTLLLTSEQAVPAAAGVRYVDAWLGVELAARWSRSARVWVFPVFTPLRSLEGVEWVYQSTVTLPTWDVTLAPGASWSVDILANIVTEPSADAHAEEAAGAVLGSSRR